LRECSEAERTRSVGSARHGSRQVALTAPGWPGAIVTPLLLTVGRFIDAEALERVSQTIGLARGVHAETPALGQAIGVDVASRCDAATGVVGSGDDAALAR
jgi:hypothetical protein